MKKLVIIDGNAIIHRAYHALPPFTTKDGTLVNAVYGFTSMLLKALQDLKPTHVAVCFDVAGKTFRDELYKEYKAKRVKAEQALYDQIPLVYKVVEAFGFPIYTKEGYEADDVIGTIVSKEQESKGAREQLEIIIVTGDMDILQLVNDHIKVYELRKGLSDIVMFDREKVKEKYGFGPEHVVDYKALRGDVSDNIPGVKGIGEKTATEMIQEFGSVESLYKKLETGNWKLENIKAGVISKLKEGKENAQMSKKLATIERDVPGLKFDLDDCKIDVLDSASAKAPADKQEKIKKLLQQFEFYSLLKRLPGGEQKSTENTENTESKKAKKHENTTSSKRKLSIVTSETLKEFLRELNKVSIFAAREVIQGKDVLTGEFVGIVFGLPKREWYAELKQLKEKELAELFSLFDNESALLLGHDLKQLVKALLMNGIEVKNTLFDTMIAAYIIDSSTRAHDLGSLVMRELGQELPASADQGSLFGVDASASAAQLRYVWGLYERFSKALAERGDRGLFDNIEMKLIPALADMELNGVAVDAEMLAKLSKEVAGALEKVTKKIWKEAGTEFNVASSAQLRDILFEKMKLPIAGVKKGKTGFSTAASELEKLRGLHPVIEMIEEHRELAKLQNTYIDVLPALINNKTGRIHTSFNQTVASTGRLSSSDPNLQNIPIRTELGKKIRDAFIAEDGNALVTADYSQIELRIVASLARDEKMIQIFKEGKDIHQATAAAINGVPLDKVTREMRYAAKEINFGVLYGMGAYGLSWRAGIPQAQAEEFIRKYFEQFDGVKKYIDQTLAFAKQEGYVETLFGRRRHIPELKSTNFQLRSAGERMAINMPIQGTAADLMKMAMIKVHEELNMFEEYREKTPSLSPPLRGRIERGFAPVRMILQVHDELVLEVKKGLEDEVGEMVKKAMEGVATLRVPIEVHVASGKRWGELK